MIMRRIELTRGSELPAEELQRSGGLDAEILGVAQRIIDDVRARGDEALRDYTSRFDKVEIGDLRVTDEDIDASELLVDDGFAEAVSAAAAAIEDFHRRQVPQSWFTTVEGGVFLGAQVTALRRVGIYVPGGRAKYPSSVLMNAIPAVVAGVDEIAMVVPPAPDGSVDPRRSTRPRRWGCPRSTRSAARRRSRRSRTARRASRGSTRSSGPGNAYVTAAKKLVMGDVGIDMLAGPSEVLILADETAVPAFVAIDLMAQAEHDPKAATWLVTTDASLPDEVEEALEMLLEGSPRADVVRRSLTDNGRIVVCPGLDVALDVANLIAPEHLEVQMADAFRAARQHPQRGRDLPRALDAGERGRLRGRPQPRAAHRRDGAFQLAAVGRGLREEVQRARSSAIRARLSRWTGRLRCGWQPPRGSTATRTPSRCASRCPSGRKSSGPTAPGTARAGRPRPLRRQGGQGRGHAREQREPGQPAQRDHREARCATPRVPLQPLPGPHGPRAASPDRRSERSRRGERAGG